MKHVAIGEGLANSADLKSLDDLPDFRRATMNMKFAFLAAREALRSLPSEISRDDLALVVQTRFGELRSTCDFLFGVSVEKVSRPLAFQNSLHHSTLGFLSRAFKITGPGLTVCGEGINGEEARDTASSLLDDGAKFALIVTVDVAVEAVQGTGTPRGSSAILLRNADV